MQVARVAVSEEEWRAFRHAAVAQGASVSAYLGRLVKAELRRSRTRPDSRRGRKPSDADEAIAALVDVRVAIDELDGIAGRLARSATTHGGSCEDVASSLRLTPAAARAAYRASGPG